MDLSNKIDAHITTIKIPLGNIDIKKAQQENDRLIEIIQNMEFEGQEQQFVDKITATDCYCE